MTKRTTVSGPNDSLKPTESEGFKSLTELALDLRWSWNHAADEVWRQLDPVLWDLTHHPYDVLQTVSRERIKSVLADPAFRKKIDGLVPAQETGGGSNYVVRTTTSQISPELCGVFQHGIHVE